MTTRVEVPTAVDELGRPPGVTNFTIPAGEFVKLEYKGFELFDIAGRCCDVITMNFGGWMEDDAGAAVTGYDNRGAGGRREDDGEF